MKSDNKNANIQDSSSDEAPIGAFAVIPWFKGVAGSIFRTTERFIRNIPSRLRNKYLRYRNEKKRLPKRKTKSKVYVLVGYTTKEHVDRRFTGIKVQRMIRKFLLLIILLVFLLIMYKLLDPLGNTNEIKQIVGINKIDDLAQNDPFGDSTGTSNQIQISTITITQAPTQTPTQTTNITGTESVSGTP